MRHDLQRLPLAWLVASALACGGCAGRAPDVEIGPEIRVAEFVGPRGRIVVDTERRVLGIGGAEFALDDCSTGTVHCFSSVAAGFHIAFPRDCGKYPYADTAGSSPWTFEMTRAAPHSHPLNGGYVSGLSDRFAYLYSARFGLFQIRYDDSGAMRFGHGEKGGRLNWDEAAPFSYRLSEGTRFLACLGR